VTTGARTRRDTSGGRTRLAGNALQEAIVRTVKPRGFTLLEMMVVLGIIAILLGLAVPTLMRSRPKATLDSVTTDLEGMLHSARQEALARGTNVAVLVFPDYVADVGYRGRFFMIQDEPLPNASFFDAATPLPHHSNFATFDPASPTVTPNGQVLETLDLPRGVLVGPATGSGSPNLPFPYSSIATGTDCGFCGTDGNRRGAVSFDPRGRPTFYEISSSAIQEVPDTDAGASISVFHELLTQSTTFVITKPQGVVRALHNG
jgi:prepilin-type N-terminal cleavage/methylation domain-containing protein